MFMSGHPLDHFKFEINHYGILQLAEFNEVKDAVSLQANPGKSFRLAGLVIDAQHRVTKTVSNSDLLPSKIIPENLNSSYGARIMHGFPITWKKVKTFL